MLERLGTPRGQEDDPRPRLLAKLFKEQQDLVLDPSRYKSALCPRRAGKSFCTNVHMILTALNKPGAVIIYGTMTRIQARNNVWKGPSSLKRLDDEFGLNISYHDTNLEATFPNGSVIRLTGIDSRAETDRLRGGSYDLVVIDEGASVAMDVLDELTLEILAPALNDRMGQLLMIGTPGSVTAGPFFMSTSESEKGVRPWKDREAWGSKPYRWSFHKWTVENNVAMPHIWRIALEDKEVNGWLDTDPRWRREYLGEWVPNHDLRVFAFKPDEHSWLPKVPGPNGLPPGHDWDYVLGLDFGFEDPCAVSVLAYSRTSKVAYHCWTRKQQHLSISEIASVIREAQNVFGSFVAMVCDAGGFGKAMMETLNKEYGFFLKPAAKKERYDFIELLNCDMLAGHFKVLQGSPVAEEMMKLQWVNEFKRDVQRSQSGSRGADDHATDSVLYAWMYMHHHFQKPRENQVELYSEAYWEQWEQESIDKLVEERTADTNFEIDYL